MTSDRPRPLAFGLDLALYVGLPLVGLFVWGWDWRPIVLLYWLENVTIGGLTFISLERRRRGGAPSGGMPPFFFLAHYGIFTFVHGVFVIVMLSLLPSISGVQGEPFSPVLVISAWVLATSVQWLLAVRADPPRVDGIGRAYARVGALHVTILGGVWLIIAFGLPAIVAVALVLVHALIDGAVALMTRRSPGGRWVVTKTGAASWHASYVRD